jgi:hypothetical protein
LPDDERLTLNNIASETLKGFDAEEEDVLKLMRFKTLMRCYRFTRSNEENNQLVIQAFQFVNDRKYLWTKDVDSCINFINNYVLYLINDGQDYERAEECLNRLKKVLDNKQIRHLPYYLIKKINIVTNAEIGMACDRGDFSNINTLARSLDSDLKKLNSVEVTRFNFVIYNMAKMFFLQGDYSKSVAWLNRIIHSYRYDSINLYVSVFLTYLINHLELKNTTVVTYYAKHFKEELRKKKVLTPDGAAVFDIMAKLALNNSEKKQQELSQNLLLILQNTSDKTLVEFLIHGSVDSWFSKKVASSSKALI